MPSARPAAATLAVIAAPFATQAQTCPPDEIFAPEVRYSSSLNPTAVALGDLDGDGDLDIAVTITSESSRVRVLF
ncbi:MAG: VCBS repeat-containing protein, partial [Phycisphaerales bacterium]|nr:VCBS repeat-containing protein [Phycisphaerales bacterium]